MQKRFLRFAAFSGAIAVTLGAMGAHFLKGKMEAGIISEQQLHAFETGVKYQVYHTIMLVLVVLLQAHIGQKHLNRAGNCFIAGILLFSGSIYLLSTAPLFGVESMRWLGPVTPVGGLFLIAGWLFLAIGTFNKNSAK